MTFASVVAVILCGSGSGSSGGDGGGKVGVLIRAGSPYSRKNILVVLPPFAWRAITLARSTATGTAAWPRLSFLSHPDGVTTYRRVVSHRFYRV